MANYLWVGGEDTGFPNGSAVGVDTNLGRYRSAYARCAIDATSGTLSTPAKSTLFTGGAVTSCWLTFRQWNNGNNGYLGLGQSGQNNFLALLMNGTNLQLGTVVGGTFSSLRNVNPLTNSGMSRIDLQVVNYGASATVNVYVNGTQYIAYSGSISMSGVTGFDSVFFWGFTVASEILVSDSSTLAIQGVCCFYPSGNGTTQSWSNPAYTNFNPTAINDANSTYTNTTAQDEQATIPGMPSGAFSIPVVKIEARAMATAGATAANLKLGFRNAGGTVAVNPQHALTTAFTTYEDYFTTDPTTSSAWTTLTSYQLDLRSA